MEMINWEEFLLPYEQAVNEIKLKLENVVSQLRAVNKNSYIDQIYGRVKQSGSILQKANRKKISINVESLAKEMEDIAGIRIICYFVEDIEKILTLLKQRQGFDLEILTTRDYVNNIKPSGYRSFHVIALYPMMYQGSIKHVKVEFQIRTMSMNFWATAEHSLKYKYQNNIPPKLQERLFASAEAAANLDNEMSNIRDEINEAERIIKMKNDAVTHIVANLMNLRLVGKLSEVDELQKEFTEIYNAEDLNRLLAFEEEVRILTERYKH